MHWKKRSLLCLSALLLASQPASAVVNSVGDYRDDFNGAAFPAEWRYLWNAPTLWTGTTTPAGNGNTGPITDVSSYIPLNPVSGTWRPDLNTTGTDGPPGNFLLFTSTGGHPGRGSTQAEGAVANNLDRYAITEYTVQNSGLVFIQNSFYQNTNLGASNGAQVFVFTDPTAPTKNLIVPDNGTRGFDHFVGHMEAGSKLYVAFGPNTADGSDGFATDFTIVQSSSKFESIDTVANYRSDFNGTTAPSGWQYLWNAPSQWTGTTTPAGNGTTGTIGDPANYIALNPVSATWRPDLNTTGTDGPPGNFLLLTSTGGHPGRGSSQAEGAVGNSLNRYAIAAFTVDTPGFYMLHDSFIDPVDAVGNGGDVIVHINDMPFLLQRFFDDQPINFDLTLGQLNIGDTIYVAVGPNGADGNDNFLWNFSISRLVPVPEPATGLLMVVGLGVLARRKRQQA